MDPLVSGVPRWLTAAELARAAQVQSVVEVIEVVIDIVGVQEDDMDESGDCVRCGEPIGSCEALDTEAGLIHLECLLPLRGEAAGGMRFIEGPEP